MMKIYGQFDADGDVGDADDGGGDDGEDGDVDHDDDGDALKLQEFSE